MKGNADDLAIVVVGASGHLARTKILPALFALYCQKHLPERFRIIGFARSAWSDETFRGEIEKNLTCRYTPEESCEDRMQEFLERCSYTAGQYDSSEDFAGLSTRIAELHGGEPSRLLFYLAVPPDVFPVVARVIGEAGMARRNETDLSTRVVIEKPFGRDRESSDALTRQMAAVFDEEQLYRIDHYLGKEVIQNLLVLRFANLVFEPIWNRHFIRDVQVTWKENLSIEGRGGYFDDAGIIRDVMQNHLLQILSLVAMEPPPRMDARHIRNAKVNALISVPPPTASDVVIGQYTARRVDGLTVPGYCEDPSVPSDSKTPTYAAVSLRIENPRWDGVPFLVRAGKGLDGRMTEIRIRFRDIPGRMFRGEHGRPAPNELVIRVQPDEAIILNIMNKVPGLDMELEPRALDLRYESAFSELIPDAYEDLLLDVLNGEKSLFIRQDELAAAWDIFTPVLQKMETEGAEPEPYAFGSGGPAGADELAERHGVNWQ